LRWHVLASSALPADVKERFVSQQRPRLTKEGELLIISQRWRDQAKNLADCREKLRELVLQALHPPKPRRPTRPSLGSKLRRQAAKKHRAQTKAARRTPREE
jgi:ribosome-associated protein